MCDEVTAFVSSILLSYTYHESLYSKAVTSSEAKNGLKQVWNGPKNTPKSKSANMENFDTVGKSIKNMTKKA